MSSLQVAPRHNYCRLQNATANCTMHGSSLDPLGASWGREATLFNCNMVVLGVKLRASIPGCMRKLCEESIRKNCLLRRLQGGSFGMKPETLVSEEREKPEIPRMRRSTCMRRSAGIRPGRATCSHRHIQEPRAKKSHRKPGSTSTATGQENIADRDDNLSLETLSEERKSLLSTEGSFLHLFPAR